MLNVDNATKKLIADLIYRGTHRILPKGGTIEQSCFYHAVSANQIIQQVIDSDKLRKPGQPRSKILVQAGSASWPRIKPEDDDGAMNTHLSYVWEQETAFHANLLLQRTKALPEIHCWNAIVTPGHDPILLDFTIKYLPRICESLIGEKWTAATPPDFYWGTADELPPNVNYTPNQEAVKFVYGLLGCEISNFTPLMKG